MRSGARILASATAWAFLGATPARAVADPAIILVLLHDGRFDAAQAVLHAGGPLTRPDDLFFDAFTAYWRVVFDDENPALRQLLDGRLRAAIQAAETASRAGTDGDAALWGGSSHLLVAELRAFERRPIAAAFEARKAKRLLESASIVGAERFDALFGLGAYNYVADTVPSYVKGLRALLFLPRGDRARGLEQLAEAAAQSRFFALEARTLLVTIYANRHERLYDRALGERDRLLEEFPDTIASLYAAARLDLSLGRNGAAIARLNRAEERARALADVDPVVLRSIDLLIARAHLGSLRPDLAAAAAGRALESGQGLGASIRVDLEALYATASRLADRPNLDLIAGDASLQAGRAQEAWERLALAAGSGLPPELRAECALRRGQAADLLGQRSLALELYRTAAGTPGFAARDAAFYYQQAPYRSAP